MGAIAAREADATIVTTDNPRSEDPRAIVRGILRGVPARRRAAVRVEPDRAGAIELAVSSAAPGDVVLLLGKGAERTQEVAGRTYRFSDTQAARRALERRLGDADANARPRLTAEAALMLDGQGRVLFARRADAAHAPASLVKLMTLYLAYEEIAAGRARFDDRVTISRYAALTPHPRLPLREGDTLSLSSVLAMVAVRSSNAAATALAEHLAGDEAAFVVRMNRRAKTLGLTATHFATAHGLPHRRQRTTAHDVARLLGRLLADHPASAKILNGRDFVFRGRTYRRNIPLFRDPGGIRALKTGFTGEAGYNLAPAARNAGRPVLLVVLGASTRASSFAERAGRCCATSARPGLTPDGRFQTMRLPPTRDAVAPDGSTCGCCCSSPAAAWRTSSWRRGGRPPRSPIAASRRSGSSCPAAARCGAGRATRRVVTWSPASA